MPGHSESRPSYAFAVFPVAVLAATLCCCCCFRRHRALLRTWASLDGAASWCGRHRHYHRVLAGADIQGALSLRASARTAGRGGSAVDRSSSTTAYRATVNVARMKSPACSDCSCCDGAASHATLTFDVQPEFKLPATHHLPTTAALIHSPTSHSEPTVHCRMYAAVTPQAGSTLTHRRMVQHSSYTVRQ